MAYRHFTEMPVWQQAHKVVLLVYKLTSAFPESEKYALTSQMRRAAVSITSNIAEAFGRQTSKDKIRFYLHARGSCYEVQSQGYIARDLNYLAPADFAEHHQRLDQIVHELNTTTAVARNVILSDRRERRISLLRCISNRKNEILRRSAPQNDEVRL